MTKISNTHKFSAAAAGGEGALFNILTFGSSAEASSVFSCEGTTFNSIVSCCHEMTNGQLPYSMLRSGKNCAQVATCHAKKSVSTAPAAVAAVAPVKKRCYIKLADDNSKGGGGPGHGGGPGRSRGRSAQ